MNLSDKYRVLLKTSSGTEEHELLITSSGVQCSVNIFDPGDWQIHKFSGRKDAVGRDIFEGDKVNEMIYGRCKVDYDPRFGFRLIRIKDKKVIKMPDNPYNLLIIE